MCLLLFSCAALAQNGATLYKQHCAACHDAPQGRTPSVDALRQMSATAILKVLDGGVMREQAQGLSTSERAEIADYLGKPSSSARETAAQASAGYCKNTAPTNSSGRSDWNGFGASLANTRFQTAAAAGLSPADVPKLRFKWAFGLGDVTNSRGQPVIVGGRLFAETVAGKLYALDANSGCLYWAFDAESSIRSGVAVNKSAVYFGDSKANAYAVDVTSGKLLWKTHVDEHPAAMITDAPSFYDGLVYLGVSSLEEVVGQKKDYECCTFRGSVVALDALTGKVVWKTYTITDDPKPTTKSAGVQQRGPSGAGVWSTPTIDEKANAIYVSTGDNYSDPTTDTSDAVLAFDRSTGKLLWSRQVTSNDAYNLACNVQGPGNCPVSRGPDFDFGQPPILVSLSNGKRELVIGQKSGVAYGIDPDQQGKILWQTRVGKGSSLGGSQWGSATDGDHMYVAVGDIAFRPTKENPSKYEVDPEKGGGLFALDLISGEKVWSAMPQPCGERKNCSPAQMGAVSVIPGVVFEGSMDGHLRAYATASGAIVWDFDTERVYDTVNGQKAHGGSLDGGGPAIAGGMVYTYSGYGQWSGMPGNVLLAFSVDGK
ncbi:MAG TPA: PQQ-binding-like beta-propeller repeat protein [Candidatus Sulfotelmatobacter sp.]|nr:PQQ-binding-like beta-propeller repeat protein [Candidatus Sulfotelmatobacter sp.]